MRTSTKIFIAGLALLALCILGYDLLLKKEFLTGNYKDIYSRYIPLQYKDFDALEINAPQKASVSIVRGPFGVRAEPHVLEYIHFTQTGRLLQMNMKYSAERFYNGDGYRVVISCPYLTDVKTSAFITINNQKVIDTAVNDNWNYGKVLIDGFKQDSLTITQDYGSHVVLANNHIGMLNAMVGLSPLSGSRITILKSNQFDVAKLQVLNKSTLILNEAKINHLDYRPGDSTQLTINGAAKNSLLPYIYPKQ
ncbi:hypothetical protein [Mucilaginibacter sp. FT3.2]|uniref:hypothetical protein n=1 Tax=Mucilaginibacter sp. FT3.2 TaxID=2723090 RepID=UPI00161FD9DD|nr:hypothetical protein [Mucilaginibacter sp. FT3.2]MBB6235270.1 hypothetical protein [Mucilaginibacter sp. FT3.2]